MRKPRSPRESAGERSLFERRKRELEQLRREQTERQAGRRRLERLSRDLGDAAEAFANGASDEAQRELEEAARELERFAERQRAGQSARELAREASQLREHLQRNAGGGGQQEGQASASGGERDQRRQRFMLRARGEQGGEQVSLSLRQDGSEQTGAQGHQGQDQNQDRTGDQGGAGSQSGAARGKSGERQGQEEAPSEEQSGQGGEKTRMLVSGGNAGDGEQAELMIPRLTRSAQTLGDGTGNERGAPPLPSPTSLRATHTDSAVAGTQGKGPTRSQVILDAADRGFRSTPYQKVYADYRSHAERVIEHDQVPQGHRFYVRRYFQLIRPRDE